MPELPEVENVCRSLRPKLVGRTLDRVALFRDDYATPAGFDWTALAGRRVEGVRRRAKKVVVELDLGEAFVVHLGMTGQLTIGPADRPTLPHTHAVFRLDLRELRLVDPRRFGRLHWLGGDLAQIDANLGPEPLMLRPARLAALLARSRRPIKSALLDQTLIAGLGNIYADEALFASGIHPLTPCRAIARPAVTRLSRAIKRTLTVAIAAGGSTLRDYVNADGTAGGFQLSHRVYARTSQPCRRCRTSVERLVLSGRSTHFCPTCQPALAA